MYLSKHFHFKKTDSYLWLTMVAHDGFGMRPRLAIRKRDHDQYFYFQFSWWRFHFYWVRSAGFSCNVYERVAKKTEFQLQQNIERYHGGISCMDLGAFKMPLPFPEIGKKWAARWYDTPSGELLPELQQVPLDAPNSEWKDGYPKYDR